MPALDRAALRMGSAELIARADVPTGVVLAETVELASRFSTDGSGRFVNGLLARVAEEVRGDGRAAPPMSRSQRAEPLVPHGRRAHHRPRRGDPALGPATTGPRPMRASACPIGTIIAASPSTTDRLARVVDGRLSFEAWCAEIGVDVAGAPRRRRRRVSPRRWADADVAPSTSPSLELVAGRPARSCPWRCCPTPAPTCSSTSSCAGSPTRSTPSSARPTSGPPSRTPAAFRAAAELPRRAARSLPVRRRHARARRGRPRPRHAGRALHRRRGAARAARVAAARPVTPAALPRCRCPTRRSPTASSRLRPWPTVRRRRARGGLGRSRGRALDRRARVEHDLAARSPLDRRATPHRRARGLSLDLVVDVDGVVVGEVGLAAHRRRRGAPPRSAGGSRRPPRPGPGHAGRPACWLRGRSRSCASTPRWRAATAANPASGARRPPRLGFDGDPDRRATASRGTGRSRRCRGCVRSRA